MKITRLDLDGVGSPRGLAGRIHEIEDLPLAVPVEDLCCALDIVSIEEIETDAFEAALVTDAMRSSGDILVNRNSSSLRRRFSIAHELGHFLVEAHQAVADRPRHCALGDLHLLAPVAMTGDGILRGRPIPSPRSFSCRPSGFENS